MVGQLMALAADNAVELLFAFAAFLIVYLIARLLNATPLVSVCFGVLPPLVAYLGQHPQGPTSLLALLR
ncbi:hypothetical protein [Devosia sp. SL43]|uniref:hypothetical protein n=1 Tax=Devosia sp. SL43 TaxID=2806348 RepID=UPI001F1713E7|nr:hypothetical protein [Devosia sp. SL43]UJW84657.1 hypothetical protein IM737_14660 [Devosia sp. SL43]